MKKDKLITATEYAAQQAKVAAELIQTGEMPTFEQLQAALAIARENLKRKASGNSA